MDIVNIIVPSTGNRLSKILPGYILHKRASQVEHVLCELFGGSTTYHGALGKWLDDGNALISERVAIVTSASFDNDLLKLAEVNLWCEMWRDKWRQDCILTYVYELKSLELI